MRWFGWTLFFFFFPYFSSSKDMLAFLATYRIIQDKRTEKLHLYAIYFHEN